jgi:hypothetical protein
MMALSFLAANGPPGHSMERFRSPRIPDGYGTDRYSDAYVKPSGYNGQEAVVCFPVAVYDDDYLDGEWEFLDTEAEEEIDGENGQPDYWPDPVPSAKAPKNTGETTKASTVDTIEIEESFNTEPGVQARSRQEKVGKKA